MHYTLDGGGTFYCVECRAPEKDTGTIAPAFSTTRDAELWRRLYDKRFKEIIIIMEDEPKGGE